MSDSLKSLADRIREQQRSGGASAPADTVEADKNKTIETNTIVEPKNERKEVVKEKKTRKKKEVVKVTDGDLVSQIKSFTFDDAESMIHLRISPSMHRKLIALNAAKISTQKFGVFAILQLLEHPDIKEILKKMRNDLD